MAPSLLILTYTAIPYQLRRNQDRTSWSGMQAKLSLCRLRIQTLQPFSTLKATDDIWRQSVLMDSFYGFAIHLRTGTSAPIAPHGLRLFVLKRQNRASIRPQSATGMVTRIMASCLCNLAGRSLEWLMR